jgi:hypothetical protein
MAKKRLRQWETASLQLLTPQVRLANLQFLQIYNFYKFTIFTNLQFLQIYNFYKFTIFTNLQFLQIYNFYKFTIFTNLQFLQIYRESDVLKHFRRRNCETKCRVFVNRQIFASPGANPTKLKKLFLFFKKILS